MALGNLRAIGPISVNYRDPQLRWTSSPTSHGIRPATISGLIQTSAAQQLSELVANPALQVTVGGRTGVLEWVEMDGEVLAPWSGYYILERFSASIEHRYAIGGSAGFTPFALDAAFLGPAAPASPSVLSMVVVEDWTAFPTLQNGFTTGGALGNAEYRILRPPDELLPGGGAVLEDWMQWRGGLITPDPPPGANICNFSPIDFVYYQLPYADLMPSAGYGGVGVRTRFELGGVNATLNRVGGADVANEETDLSYWGPFRIVRT